MSVASSNDMLIIQKKCLQTYKNNKENICLCLKDNLQRKLSKRQISELAKIYKDHSKRYLAAKDPGKKNILDFDYEVHRNCGLNPGWRWVAEDLGTPDPL